jgi:hypothetical protein
VEAIETQISTRVTDFHWLWWHRATLLFLPRLSRMRQILFWIENYEAIMSRQDNIHFTEKKVAGRLLKMGFKQWERPGPQPIAEMWKARWLLHKLGQGQR